MKILSITADEVLRRRLDSYLRKSGHAVYHADDAPGALSVLLREEISTVLFDQKLAELSIGAWVQQVHRSRRDLPLYVILLMEHPEMAALDAALQAGVNDVITSPFDDADLRLRIHMCEQILNMREALARQTHELTEAYHYLKRDLEMAARIQKSMLPTNLPRQKGVQCCWMLEPCEDLAGDILNVFKLPGDQLGFYLIDVSGHGVASALISVALFRLLSTGTAKSYLLQPETQHPESPVITSPAQVAQMLNNQFQVNSEYRYFFTFFYGIIDHPNMELRYVAAGHPGMVLFSRDQGQFLTSHGPPVGCLPDFAYQEAVVPLHRGDRIYVYSDGFIETRNAQREQIGNQRIFEALLRLQERSLEQSVFELVNQINAWRGSPRAADDISILAVEIDADARGKQPAKTLQKGLSRLVPGGRQ